MSIHKINNLKRTNDDKLIEYHNKKTLLIGNEVGEVCFYKITYETRKDIKNIQNVIHYKSELKNNKYYQISSDINNCNKLKCYIHDHCNCVDINNCDGLVNR